MTRVADVTTPTLLLHGDADIRAPSAGGQWHAACGNSGIDTRLVRYPGASHLFILDGMPSHRSTTTSGWWTGGAVRKRDQAAEIDPSC